MKFKNLLPVTLFCVIFLVYTLYFVKVISSPQRLPPNMIARTMKEMLRENAEPKAMPKTEKVVPKQKNPVVEQKIEAPKAEVSLGTRYVNYDWLNVRKSPSILSAVLEKIYLNDEVSVLGIENGSWIHIKTASGAKGYVAGKYLSEEKQVVKAEETVKPLSNVFNIPIISYHHVTDGKNNFPVNLTLPTVNFLAQLGYLTGNDVKTLTFFDLKAIAAGEMTAPKKSVILTFDDGYADNYQVAQHLNGKGLKGVFFIITDDIGKPGYLDWRQVKKMRSWGMDIGSHGVKSGDLVVSPDFFFKVELERSKKIIEEKLGEKIISFAYPAGRYNDKTIDLVDKAGYDFARTIVSGSQYKTSQFLKLPTLRVFPPAGAKQFKVWLSSD